MQELSSYFKDKESTIMISDKIENLRNRLNSIIFQNEEYDKILKTSQELDELIVQYMYQNNN